jgi:hypothetical protein
MLHQKSKDDFVAEIVDIALLATHRFPYPYSQIYSDRGLKSINVGINA